MRISSLLLSPNGYGIGKIAALITKYRDTLAKDEGIMFNENAMGYLGILGVLGFLLLLAVLFTGIRWDRKPSLSGRLWLLARLNLAAVLLGTISGFGALVTIAVRLIRGHTRISSYIAFFCILAAALCAEELLRRLRGKRLAAAAVCLAPVSYTHLDVYKRQLCGRFLVRPRCHRCVFGGGRRCHAPE